MKRYSWLFLALVPLLSGCPKKPTSPDYDAVKQRADKASQDVDNQSPTP